MRRFALLLVFCVAATVSAQQSGSDAPATAVASADPAGAPEIAKKPKLDETIVVTATRGERTVSEMPVSTTVVSQKEIKSAPAIFVDDLLRTIPGVHMTLQGSSNTLASGQRISMHGLGGTRALVLLDGMPIHDPYYGTVQWQKVPLDSLRQIEVVRGGNASLFGNFALGGTINMITRPVSDDDVALDASYGSMQTSRESISGDYMVNDRLGVRLSHHRYNSNGYFRVPNPGAVDIPSWNDSAVSSLRVDYRPTDTTTAFLKSSFAQLDLSQGTALSTSDRDIFDLAAGIQHIIGTETLLSGTIFRQQQDEYSVSTSIIGADRHAEYVSNISDIPVHATGGSLEWSRQRSGSLSSFTVGVDLQEIRADEDRQSFNKNGARTQVAQVEGSQQFAGLFAQVSWHPASRVEILGSARLDYFKNANGREAVVGGSTTDYPESTSKQLDPRVSIRYALSDRSAVRGSAYRAFRAPTLRELYRTSPTGNSVIVGNPYLEPETLVGGEIGYEWAAPRAHVEVNLYRSDIKGLQARVARPDLGPNYFQNQNLSKSRSQGVELSADFRLTRSLSLNAGYTYADATIVDDPDPRIIGNLLPEVVPHIGSLSLRYQGNAGTLVDLRGRVLSTSYGEPANVAPQPAHRVVDLSVAQPVRSWIDAYALLENAFDERYYIVLNAVSFRSAQPRTLTVGLRLHLPTGGQP